MEENLKPSTALNRPVSRKNPSYKKRLMVNIGWPDYEALRTLAFSRREPITALVREGIKKIIVETEEVTV